MKTYLRIMLWTGALTIAMTLAWTVAFVSWAQRHIAVPPVRRPPTINRQFPAAINSQPPTIDAQFVASTLDRNAKRYHRPDCSYVGLLKHRREFANEYEAQSAGYEPCSRCLSTSRVARLEPPPPPQQ